MADPNKKNAAKKLAVEEPLNVPGPMLGKNGKLNPTLVADDALQMALNDVVNRVLPPNAQKEKYAFAVVDITDPNKVAYAGWNDRANLFIASLAKLLPLYAAFQLRADMRGLYQKLKNNIGSVSQNMTTLKKEALRRYEPVYASKESNIQLPIQKPEIEKIFEISSDGINFAKVKKSDTGFNDDNIFDTAELSDKYLKGIYDNKAKIDKVNFYEQMRLMVGWSDNYAASKIIDSLGYEYLWALSMRSGLYCSSWSPLTFNDQEITTGAGGLFLASNYNHGKWQTLPERARSMPSYQMGNARSLAILLTMLGMETLIDHESHIEMHEMLRKESDDFRNIDRGEESIIGRGMNIDPPLWENQQVRWRYGYPIRPMNTRLGVSKVGLTYEPDPITYCNALLVRTQRNTGKVLTAVLIGINTFDSTRDVLSKFGREIALKLDALHI